MMVTSYGQDAILKAMSTHLKKSDLPILYVELQRGHYQRLLRAQSDISKTAVGISESILHALKQGVEGKSGMARFDRLQAKFTKQSNKFKEELDKLRNLPSFDYLTVLDKEQAFVKIVDFYHEANNLEALIEVLQGKFPTIFKNIKPWMLPLWFVFDPARLKKEVRESANSHQLQIFSTYVAVTVCNLPPILFGAYSSVVSREQGSSVPIILLVLYSFFISWFSSFIQTAEPENVRIRFSLSTLIGVTLPALFTYVTVLALNVRQEDWIKAQESTLHWVSTIPSWIIVIGLMLIIILAFISPKIGDVA